MGRNPLDLGEPSPSRRGGGQMGRYPYIFVEGMSGVSAASMIDELINIPLAAIYTMLFSAIFFAAVFSLAFYYAVLRRFIPEIED